MTKKPKNFTEIFYPEEVLSIMPYNDENAKKNSFFSESEEKRYIGRKHKSVMFVMKDGKTITYFVNKDAQSLCKQMINNFFLML